MSGNVREPENTPDSVGARNYRSGYPRYQKSRPQQQKRQRRCTDFGFRAPTLLLDEGAARTLGKEFADNGRFANFAP